MPPPPAVAARPADGSCPARGAATVLPRPYNPITPRPRRNPCAPLVSPRLPVIVFSLIANASPREVPLENGVIREPDGN